MDEMVKATRLYDEDSLVHLTLATVGRLRIIAWEASGPRPKMAPKDGDTWIDSHDGHAHHWIVMEGIELWQLRGCVFTQS